MRFQKIDLDHVLFLLQEPAQVLEAPGAAVHRHSGGLLDALDRVFFGETEQALEHAQAVGSPLGVDRFGPSTGVGAHQLATFEEVVGTALDDTALVRMNMRVIGGELALLDPRMDGNHLHALVENAQDARLGPDPKSAAEELRWNRIKSALVLDMTVAVDGAPGFDEAGKQIGGQRQQGRLLGLEQCCDLLAHGAMGARVGDGGAPGWPKKI